VHLVDIENLAAGSDADDAVVARAFDLYWAAAEVRRRDHVIVGCGPVLARRAFFVCPPRARLVVGRGRNGADRALSEAISPVAGTVTRYHGIVIGSGDQHFAWVARRFALAHRSVEVVARPGTVSALLDRPSYRLSFIAPDAHADGSTRRVRRPFRWRAGEPRRSESSTSA
jgi:hypothetical protein